MSIVIGLGGNVGTEAEILERFTFAREALAGLGSVRSAPLYRTAPIGPAQPAFYNTAVALVADDVQPRELIEIVLEIERMLGRDRSAETRWGPRTIDLDVLVWDDRAFRIEALEVPHPRLTERRFALAPVAELLGEDAVVAGKPLRAWLAGVREQEIEYLATTW